MTRGHSLYRQLYAQWLIRQEGKSNYAMPENATKCCRQRSEGARVMFTPGDKFAGTPEPTHGYLALFNSPFCSCVRQGDTC